MKNIDAFALKMKPKTDGMAESLKSAMRLSRRTKFDAMIKQSLASAHFSSVLEPRQFHSIDQKRPDGLTLVPWAADRHCGM